MKIYRGHTIKRQSGNGYMLWFVALRNGRKVASGQSIREVELKVDRLVDVDGQGSKESSSARSVLMATGSSGNSPEQ